MGWGDWPWYTTADDFGADFDVDQYFGINVFLRDGDEIYRTYSTTGRAAEELSSVWALLDITPFGAIQVCTQTCNAGSPCPNDADGNTVTCDAATSFCQPTVANNCKLN